MNSFIANHVANQYYAYAIHEKKAKRRCERGAPKDSKWHDKKYLCEMRANFARIQNEVEILL